MTPVKNLGEKRVCDVSDDGKIILIERGGHTTMITANADGTLHIVHVN